MQVKSSLQTKERIQAKYSLVNNYISLFTRDEIVHSQDVHILYFKNFRSKHFKIFQQTISIQVNCYKKQLIDRQRWSRGGFLSKNSTF